MLETVLRILRALLWDGIFEYFGVLILASTSNSVLLSTPEQSMIVTVSVVCGKAGIGRPKEAICKQTHTESAPRFSVAEEQDRSVSMLIDRGPLYHECHSNCELKQANKMAKLN